MRTRSYKIFLLVCFLCVVRNVVGVPDIGAVHERFANRKLSQLSELMPSMSWPGHDTIMGYASLPRNKSLVIRYNHKQEVEHLGVSLFSKETKAMIDESVCDFLERIFLELTLQETNEDVKRKLLEYHILLHYNGFNIGENVFSSMRHVLQELTMPVNFTIRYENKYASASWSLNPNKQLSMLFPVSRELIDGMDKKESDTQLYNRLAQAQTERLSFVDTPVEEKELLKQGNNLYVRKGTQYLIPSLSSDIYYERKDSEFTPLFSLSMPEKSLCTLFQTYTNGEHKKLLITHRQYGYFTPEIELPLNDFLSLFKRDFDIFSATNKNKKGEFETLVVIRHKVLNYIHLLRTKVTLEELEESPLTLKADFYSNIPQHYIKSLFNVKAK